MADATGTTYTFEGEWKKEPGSGQIEVTLTPPPAGNPPTPPGNFGMEIKDRDGRLLREVTVKMPSIAAGSGEVRVKATAVDPWVVQIPQDWQIQSVDYSTPVGTVAATLTHGSVPWNLAITPGGPVASDFYLPEPGYHIYLVEVPESMLVGGRHSARVLISCAVEARRKDTVKVIEAGIMSVEGHSARAFFPLNTNITDFAQYSDLFLTFDVELGVESCRSPSGHQPKFSIPDCQGWEVGGVGFMLVRGLDPSAPAMYMIGGATYLSPGVVMPDLGCMLNVSLDAAAPLPVNVQGEASLSMAIAADPNLRGAVLFWQTAQLYSGSSILTSDVLQTIVE